MLQKILFYIFLIGHITPMERDNGPDGFESQGIPFKALIIWHTDARDDDSFFQQRRLIVSLIDGFPVQTNVTVITVGTKTNVEVTFIKDSTEFNSYWTAPLMEYAVERSEIPYILSIKINDVLSKYFDIKAKTAEEVFLIVNHNSVTDYEDKAREALELKKTSIVFYGKNSDERVNMWMNLATDKRHFHMLDNNDGNINELVESILNTTYHDSRLFCNNDQYWTGKRCYSCTHICSETVKKPSEYCGRTCPYFSHVILDTGIGTEHEHCNEKSQRSDNFSYVNYIGLNVLSFVIVIILKKMPGYFNKNWEKMRKKFEKYTLLVMKDDIHDVELGLHENGGEQASEESVSQMFTGDTDDEEFRNGRASASVESVPVMFRGDIHDEEFDLLASEETVSKMVTDGTHDGVFGLNGNGGVPASEETVPKMVTDDTHDGEFELNGNGGVPASEETVPKMVTDDTHNEVFGLNGNGGVPASEETVPKMVTDDTHDEEFGLNGNKKTPASEESVPEMVTGDNHDDEFELNGNGGVLASEETVPKMVTDDTHDEEFALNGNGGVPASEETVPKMVTDDTHDEEFGLNGNRRAPASEENLPVMVTDETNDEKFGLNGNERAPESDESLPIMVTDDTHDEEVGFNGNRRANSFQSLNEEHHRPETTDRQTQTNDDIDNVWNIYQLPLHSELSDIELKAFS